MMRQLIILNILLLASSTLFSQNVGLTLFDDDRILYKRAVLGAEKINFDDSTWRSVDYNP
jgi:hypothetical protein